MPARLTLLAVLVVFGLATAEAAQAADVSAQDLAAKLSLAYHPLKGAQEQLIGAALVGNDHKIAIMVGFRMVTVDENSVWLTGEARLVDGNVVVPDTLIEQLRARLNQPPEETTTAETPVLGERVVVIDPGHGGKDPGAIGVHYRAEEKEVNLAVSLRVAAILRANGVKTLLTRDTDDYVELDERVDIANRARADLFVSIHSNASEDPSDAGFLTIYPVDDWNDDAKGSVAEKSRAAAEKYLFAAGERLPAAARKALFIAIMQEYYIRSRAVADSISAALSRGIQTTQQGPISDPRGLRVLRGALCPAVLVECDYLSNRAGEKRLRSSAFRDKLANSIAEGIQQFLRQHPREKSE